MKKITMVILSLFLFSPAIFCATRIKIYNIGLTSETPLKITIYTAERNICNFSSDIYETVDTMFIDSLFLLMDNTMEVTNINPDIRAVMQVYHDSYLHETIYFNSQYIIRGYCVYEMSEKIHNALYRKFGDLD